MKKVKDLSMRDLGPGIVADLRIPLRAAKTIAARSLPERDGRSLFLARHKVKMNFRACEFV